ncbi:MAG: DUF4911 domain-containing protein [Desulfohalobiaceae bacterium]|nr:DUF4911 domain-containing protein [Desulfohalobiaceae bacterium]
MTASRASFGLSFSGCALGKGQAPAWSECLYIRVHRKDIAYLKFILEGYDNLALLTVVDKYEAVLHLSYAPGRQEEIQEFLEGVSKEIHLEKVFEA